MKLQTATLAINPNYILGLSNAKVFGLTRTSAQPNRMYCYYTIILDNFRSEITNVVTVYLEYKFHDKDELTSNEITQELDRVVLIIVDACMTALYARVGPVQKTSGTYANRFSVASIYSENMLLPLPLADAIQSFGTFSLAGTLTYYICVPVYPENAQNEGHVTQNWNAPLYKFAISMLKDLIPFKSIDTRI